MNGPKAKSWLPAKIVNRDAGFDDLFQLVNDVEIIRPYGETVFDPEIEKGRPGYRAACACPPIERRKGNALFLPGRCIGPWERRGARRR